MTVYVKILVSERLPNKFGNYAVVCTNRLSNIDEVQIREARFKSDYIDGSHPYFSVGDRASNDLFSGDEILAWLEEVEVPSKDMIDRCADIYFESDTSKNGFKYGVNWLLNKLKS